MKLCALLLLLTGCAHTEFFYQGQRVARFEGDMTQTKFTMTITAQGASLSWTADGVSHSQATRAQGDAAAGKITAAASLVTAGVMAAALIPK
jgi:hypothetical protein